MRSNRSDFNGLGAMIVISTAVLLIGFTIWWFVTHKCVQEQSYNCSHTYCVSKGKNDRCLEWRTDEDICTRCLQWERR